MILFGTPGDERLDLAALQLTYTTDPREADFVLTLGVGAITDDTGNVLLPNGDCETTGAWACVGVCGSEYLGMYHRR